MIVLELISNLTNSLWYPGFVIHIMNSIIMLQGGMEEQLHIAN